MPEIERGAAPVFAPHPLRAAVLGELHARPFRLVEAPRVFLHYAFAVAPGAPARADRDAFEALARAQGLPGPGPDARHHVVAFGGGTLKWERMSEFSTYQWDGPLSTGTRFEPNPPGSPFGGNFVAPGELLVAVQMHLVPDEGGGLQQATQMFDPASLCVAEVVGGRAVVATDFRADGDGRTRILVLDRGLAPNQAGALVQRLLEIETYRTFALLGLPEAQRIGPDIRRIEERLVQLTAESRGTASLEANRKLLKDLSELTADLEAGAAASSYRFGASQAYHRIVNDRLVAIDEHPVPGYPTWRSFLTRRMDPAMRTIETMVERQANLSRKLARAAQLLRTRVEIDVEQQNRELLESMNSRARMQLRLQQTVEGLSIAAVSYYVVGLIGYLLKGLKEAHALPIDPTIATALAVPLVVAALWLVVRRIRRTHTEGE